MNEVAICLPDRPERISNWPRSRYSGPSGARQALVTVGHEITRRKQTEAELQRHRDHLPTRRSPAPPT